MGHQVGCYLSFAQVEQLDDLAHAAGICRSALLRNIVADFLTEPEAKTDCSEPQRSIFLDGTSSIEPSQERQSPSLLTDVAQNGLDMLLKSDSWRRLQGLPLVV